MGRVDSLGAGEIVESEVAAALGPLVVLLGQDGADQANDGGSVGANADDVGAAAVSRLWRSLGLIEQIWRKIFSPWPSTSKKPALTIRGFTAFPKETWASISNRHGPRMIARARGVSTIRPLSPDPTWIGATMLRRRSR